jgi:hypothetical protein
MAHMRVLSSLMVAALVTLAAVPGYAKCPNQENVGDTVCEPLVSMLMPSAFGAFYAPDKRSYFGGGAEFALLSWASNNNNFGPSHGRIRANVSYLASEKNRQVLLYKFGTIVSFEGNASRRFLIPYSGAAIGGLWESELKHHAFADASLGLYLVYTRNFVLDAEGGVVLPFTDVSALLGPRAQLTASFALW